MLGSGCDRGASKRDAQFTRLSTTWTVRVLRVDQTSLDLAARDLEVQFSFYEADGGRAYRLLRTRSGDTTRTRGSVEMLGENRLLMAGGAAREFVWSFTFEEPDELNDSVRFRLDRARQEDVRDFLEAMGLSGGGQRIEMDLVRN